MGIDREVFHFLVYTSNCQHYLGLGQDFFWVSHMFTGTKSLGWSAVFSYALLGSWIRNGAAADNQTGVHTGYPHCRKCLNVLCANVRPKSILSVSLCILHISWVWVGEKECHLPIVQLLCCRRSCTGFYLRKTGFKFNFIILSKGSYHFSKFYFVVKAMFVPHDSIRFILLINKTTYNGFSI